MASKESLLYQQEVPLMAHMDDRGAVLPQGTTLQDHLRRRYKESYSGSIPTYIRKNDGEVVQEHAYPDRYRSQETLDISLGKDPSGQWIGGPFATHIVECIRRPTTMYVPSTIYYPAFLQPPEKTDHYVRYLPSFLPPPPTKALGFYNPELGADPQAISLLIDQALGQLQGARNSAKPDANYADFGQSIAELREVSQLVTLRGQRLVNLVGSAYLAIEFGWKPIISDAKKLVNMASSLKKRIDFLKRNQGKPVKRKRKLFQFTQSRGEVSSLTFGPASTYRTVEPVEGERPVMGVIQAEAWYHSVVRYDIPDIDTNPYWDSKAARYLNGLALDRSLIWELTPFTWLIDWFTNIGDHVEREWGTDLVNTSIIDEWITVKVTFAQFCTIPTVAGEISSPDIQWTNATTERYDTFKYRMIPPADAPLELLNLLPMSGNQQAILAALVASYKK